MFKHPDFVHERQFSQECHLEINPKVTRQLHLQSDRRRSSFLAPKVGAQLQVEMKDSTSNDVRRQSSLNLLHWQCFVED